MIGLNIKYILGFTISFDGDGGGGGANIQLSKINKDPFIIIYIFSLPFSVVSKC